MTDRPQSKPLKTINSKSVAENQVADHKKSEKNPKSKRNHSFWVSKWRENYTNGEKGYASRADF